MIIKNILDKIYFHPLFYIVAIISFFTAHFINFFYFTIIIFIHELGHSITGIILGMKLKRIEIYPYGGCSKLEYDINIPLYKELILLIMGPFIQIIFTYLIYYLNIDVRIYFYNYSMLILLFNLLPIYPLDGGRLLNILLSLLISFFKSIKITFIIGYFIYVTLFFIIITSRINNLFLYLVMISLGINLYIEIRNGNLIFKRFLLERYIRKYKFNKYKVISSIYKMKRDYYHTFFINNEKITESKYLEKIFTFH